jgi:hypothetical protein
MAPYFDELSAHAPNAMPAPDVFTEAASARLFSAVASESECGLMAISARSEARKFY